MVPWGEISPDGNGTLGPARASPIAAPPRETLIRPIIHIRFAWSASAMLGRDHALSGAVVFAAFAPSLHVTEAHLAAGVVLAAGAGVLPDIDHPDSTISRSFGFLTEWFAWLADRISGGHRHGTHSLV